MRPLTFNTLIFFFVYLPLTLFLGLMVDAFKVDGVDDKAGYEFCLWFVVVIQMMVPTLTLFGLIHLAIRTLGSGLHMTAKRVVSMLASGALLPLFQGFLWAGTSFSSTWLLVVVLPALVIGGIVRFPS